MLRIKLSLLAILLTSPAYAELKIVTTLPDFADLARQIGGDKVTVHSVMKGPENVHNVMARPTEMVKLNAADMFVHSGLDAEPWRDNLLLGSRNPRVARGKPGNVDMSAGVELIDVPDKIDRSLGDIHAYGNPHYSNSPVVALRLTATLAKAMAANDPLNADYYLANARKIIGEIAALNEQLAAGVKANGGVKVMTFHRAWDYWAPAYGIEIVGTIEQKIGITPSPADIAKAVEIGRAAGVKVVICEPYNDFAQAQAVAQKIGAKAIVLPNYVNGTKEATSYQAMMKFQIESILSADR